MLEKISIHEHQKLDPFQWVKVYGVTCSCYDYINTCQVYQLEAVQRSFQRGWWEEYVLEPVDEEEQPISIPRAVDKQFN